MSSQETISSNKKDKKYFVNSAISVLIMLLFGLIPPAGELTVIGMRVLGLLIGVIYAWCTVGGVWPSLVALLLLGFSGYCSVPAAFMTAIGNYTIIYVMFLLVMGAVVSQTGVAKALALRMINVKFAKGKPWALTTMIFLATMILAATTSGIATMIIIWNIVYGISESVGYKKFDKWPTMMVFGVGYISLAGCLFLPFQTTLTAQIGIFQGMYEGFSLPYGNYLLFGLVILTILFVVFMLVMRFLVKPDMSLIANYEQVEEIAPLNTDQKFSIGMVAAFVLLILVPMLLPATNPIRIFFSKLGSMGVVIFIVICVLFLRRKGNNIFEYKELAYRGVGWTMIFMVATAIKLSSALLSEESGMTSFLLTTMKPLLGNMSPFVFLAVVALLAALLTNFMNNAILGITSLSLLASFMSLLGVNPITGFVIFTWSSSMGLFLPSASPMAAMLYGNEWMRAKDVMKFAAITIPFTILVLIVVGIPLGNALF